MARSILVVVPPLTSRLSNVGFLFFPERRKKVVVPPLTSRLSNRHRPYKWYDWSVVVPPLTSRLSNYLHHWGQSINL